MHTFARRAAALLTLVVIAAGVWMVIDGGRFLDHEDPLQRADVIFVLAGTRLERPLEGVDLFKEGWAPIIALSPGRPEPAERLVLSKGVQFPSESALTRSVMVQLGVPPSAIIADDGYVDNTASEANLLRGLVLAHGWTRVIVVTSKYHVRRAGFAFRRGLEKTHATVIMRASRYDTSDPAHWWRYRADVRYTLSEWEKLAAYWMGAGA